MIRSDDDMAHGTHRSSPIGGLATLRPGPDGNDELAVLLGRVSAVALAARPGRSELVGVRVTAPRNSRRGQRFVVDLVERDDAAGQSAGSPYKQRSRESTSDGQEWGVHATKPLDCPREPVA